MPQICKFCGHYEMNGHRMGKCALLNVPVAGTWESCGVATSVFIKKEKGLAQPSIVQSLV